MNKFLDCAVMATATRVHIVHGHGMNVQERMVGEALGKHPHLMRLYPAPQKAAREPTIVELRTRLHELRSDAGCGTAR